MPVEYRGAYWMRRGEDLVPMSPEVVQRIFAEGQPDYTAEICTIATFDDLDPEAIEKLRELWVKASGNEQLDNVAPAQLLEDAELTLGGQVTYAALILLGTHRALGRHLAQAETIFEYRSSEGSLGAQQRVEFRQGFLLYLDKLWELINLRNDAYQFHDGLFVRSIRCFNENAVREALLNALAHRDYRHGSSIFVRQFPKHMEIASPGGFPSGINAENLIYQQNPRNRRIAETLRRCNLVERAGQGADLLFRTCVQESKPLPNYSASDDHGVNLVLAAGTLDEPFLRFFEQVGSARLATLCTDDFLLLDAVHRGLELTSRLRTRLTHVVDRGLVTDTEGNLRLRSSERLHAPEAHDPDLEAHDPDLEAHDPDLEAHDPDLEAHDSDLEAHDPLLAIERKLLRLSLGEPQSTPTLLEGLGYDTRTGNFKRALAVLLERGLLVRTIPDKPRSRGQKYRLTDRGRAWLRQAKEES